MQAGSNVAERLKRLHVRRLQRLWTTLSLNLTRNSGYYALVSSVMCLCLVALKSDSHVHDDIDSELHYNFHAWDPQVNSTIGPPPPAFLYLLSNRSTCDGPSSIHVSFFFGNGKVVGHKS